MGHVARPFGVGVVPRIYGLDVIGGMRNYVAVESTDRTLVMDDGNPLVSVTTGTSDRTITLPACALANRCMDVVIRKADFAGGRVVIVPRSSAVTFTDAGDLVNWTGHGLPNDMEVLFTTSGTLPTGLVIYTRYYVVNATADTFQVSLTKGGTPETFTGTGTGNHTCWETINDNVTIWYLTRWHEWLQLIVTPQGWITIGTGLVWGVLRAPDNGGIQLLDDGGNVGLFVKDGAAGRLGVGTTDLESWDTDIHAVLDATKEALWFGDEVGGARLSFGINTYRDSSGYKAKATGGALCILATFELFRVQSAASVSADAAQTMVADLDLWTNGGTGTSLCLGGGAGGSDRDVIVSFSASAREAIVWSQTNTWFTFFVNAAEQFKVDVGGIKVRDITTTSAANVYTGVSGGFNDFRRSTSSLRYKSAVRYDAIPLVLLAQLRPIVFRSDCLLDDRSIDRFGLAAEDVHALGYRGLVHYIGLAGKEIPDGVQYQCIIPVLVAGWQDHEARIKALEARP